MKKFSLVLKLLSVKRVLMDTTLPKPNSSNITLMSMLLFQMKKKAISAILSKKLGVLLLVVTMFLKTECAHSELLYMKKLDKRLAKVKMKVKLSKKLSNILI